MTIHAARPDIHIKSELLRGETIKENTEESYQCNTR